MQAPQLGTGGGGPAFAGALVGEIACLVGAGFEVVELERPRYRIEARARAAALYAARVTEESLTDDAGLGHAEVLRLCEMVVGDMGGGAVEVSPDPDADDADRPRSWRVFVESLGRGFALDTAHRTEQDQLFEVADGLQEGYDADAPWCPSSAPSEPASE